MQFVEMIWPRTRAIARVPAGAVDGHRGIGWVPLSEWTEPKPAAAPAEAGTPTTTASKTSRRRGADSEE